MSKLYRFTQTMPACRTVCDRTSRFRRRRLQLTVGTEGELLSDRGGQNSLALADLRDGISTRLFGLTSFTVC
jgi:hypothetical protein